MTRIDQFSLTTTPIEQFFNNQLLGTATGFFWTVGGKHYLITNWHVVTCRIFPTRQYIKSHAGRPNMLRVRFNFGAQIFEKQQCDIKVRDDDDQPLWLVHPGRNLDIAVIPLLLTPDQLRVINLYPINELTSADLAIYIGMDVFVLGYPFGAGPPAYPIWKRGSIASEPDLVRLTTDYLLVDTASRPGMSGAPVILRSWGGHIMADGSNRPLASTISTRFIGVYSGRLHTQKTDEAQIGMVWHPSFIHEIIAGNMCDKD
jgi:hypothetical protein